MGCDIHFYVERKIDNKWVVQFSPKDFSYRKDVWYDGRSYSLFGLLAGVRSRDITPLAALRDLPEDCSEYIRKQHQEWDIDAHSASYYYLDELLKASKLSTTIYSFLSVKEYKEYKESNLTSSTVKYHDFYGCQDNIFISNEEMDRIVELTAFLGESEYYTKISSQVPNIDIGDPYFWKISLPLIQKLDDNPKNIRCVFWFDN